MTLSFAQRFVFAGFSILACSLKFVECSGRRTWASSPSGRSDCRRFESSDFASLGGEQSVDGDKVSSLVTTGVVISDVGEILTSEFALQGKPEAILAEDIAGKTHKCRSCCDRPSSTSCAFESQRRKVGRRFDLPPASRYELANGRLLWDDFTQRNHPMFLSESFSALHRIHGLAIQSDAKISPVNYGGPLINLQGQVMGILVPLSPRGQGSSSSGVEWYDSGIGFAIPMEDALRSAERLRSGSDLKAGKLGVKLAAAGMFSSRIRIERVVPKGPADAAGLRKDDVLVSVNND